MAIDWESIRRGAQLYQRTVTPAELCRAVREVGGIFGQVEGVEGLRGLDGVGR